MSNNEGFEADYVAGYEMSDREKLTDLEKENKALREAISGAWEAHAISEESLRVACVKIEKLRELLDSIPICSGCAEKLQLL